MGREDLRLDAINSEGAVWETTPHHYGRLLYLVNFNLCSQVKSVEASWTIPNKMPRILVERHARYDNYLKREETEEKRVAQHFKPTHFSTQKYQP